MGIPSGFDFILTGLTLTFTFLSYNCLLFAGRTFKISSSDQHNKKTPWRAETWGGGTDWS